jgi:hypothetical protein
LKDTDMATVRPEVTGRKAGRPRGKRERAPVDQRLTYTVVEAGKLIGLGRDSSYAAAARGDFPTVKVGRLILVPKIPFHKKFGELEQLEAAAGFTK